MKITIKNTPEQVELIKRMASEDSHVSYEAQAAVASIMGPIINQVINNAPTISTLYETMEFGEDDNPSIQLDLFYDITDEQHIRVWQQQTAGGLAYSQIFPTHSELKFSTYSLDSAFALDKKYVRRSRLPAVSAVFTRMAQEILLKQEKTAFNQLAQAVINASTAIAGTSAAGNHVIGSTTENQLTLDDFNRLITRSKRINASFSTGTPVGGSKVGVTDLLVSPEMVQELRAMAYQPVNTRAVPDTAESTALAAPESLRETLYSAAGLPSFYGINIIEILELGIAARYNAIFGALVAASGASISGGGGGSWVTADDEVLIGVDRTRRGLIRPAIVQEGTSEQVKLLVDDQFVARQEKVGWYGKVEEGRVVVEDRALTAIVC